MAMIATLALASCSTISPGEDPKQYFFDGYFKTYSFKLYTGGIIADNVNRLGNQAGYLVHTVNLQPGCDVLIESKVVKESNIEEMFKAIAQPYFDVAFYESGTPNQMVVLTYVGQKSDLKGCYK